MILNKDRVIGLRLIIKEYGRDIEYIPSNKNIVEDALSRFSINRNQELTQDPTYKN